MHNCKLTGILTEDQQKILGEVISEAIEVGAETLRLHKEDTPWGKFPDDVENFLALIGMQEQRMKVLNEIYNMLEGG